MRYKRLLYAPNIHQGGGKVLLSLILDELRRDKGVMFILDTRMTLPEKGLAGEIYWVQPTVFSRLWLEWRLRSLISSDMLLLCMGNLPPLFAHQGVQHVFVQNRYLIDVAPLDSFSKPVRFRLMIERGWLKSRSRYVKNFFVQTSTMQALLYKSLDQKAKVVPFANIFRKAEESNQDGLVKAYDFIYVASGEPHKKHRELIEGWINLAKQKHFPSLCLTIDRGGFPELYDWIEDMKRTYDLCVDNRGELKHEEILNLYTISKAMVYPSIFESFGLPLLEAAAASLPIVTSDMGYIYDVIKPTAVFDISSTTSIAETVKSMSSIPAMITTNLLSVEDFLNETFWLECHPENAGF